MNYNFSEELLNRSSTMEIPPKYLVNKLYHDLLLSAGVYLSILTFTTTSANGLLLLTIFKNSKPYFRKPVTILIAALAVADFLNGLIVDPLYSSMYFSLYFKSISRRSFFRVAQVSMLLSLITMNASYLMVLVLSCIQLVAITFPYKQKTIITNRSVSFSVGFVSVYSVSFALSYFLGIPQNVFLKLDLFLNMTGITVMLIAAYICLQISYTRQRDKFRRLFIRDIRNGRHSQVHFTAGGRKLLIVNLLLIACLLTTALPVTVVWYVKLFTFLTDYEMLVYRNAALVIDNFLFLKFLLDPFIYAWRMPKYRRALGQTISTCFRLLQFKHSRSSRRKRSSTQLPATTLVEMLSSKRSSSRRPKNSRDPVDKDVM